MADEPLNTASETSVRKRRKSAAFTKRAQADDILAVINTPHGRRLLWRVLDMCGVYHQADVENTNRVLVHEGKRNIGLRLIIELEVARPGAVELLRAEYHKSTEAQTS